MRFPLGAVARIENRHLVRTCGYKQQHWSHQKAVSHLNSLFLRFGSRIDTRLMVYRCRDCSAWHVGRNRPTARRTP
jgi:hypothetical protein